MNIFKDLKEKLNTMNKYMANFGREIRIFFKKTKGKFYDLKNTLPEMKISRDALNPLRT